MKTTVTLENEQWRALRQLAKLGVLAADLLGPDEPTFHVGEHDTQTAHAALQNVEDALRAQLLGHKARVPVAMEARSFPTAQAFDEGWNLDFCEQLDAYTVVDVDNHFGSNAVALARVTEQAMQGSAYHQAAVDWLNTSNALHEAAQNVQPCAKFEEQGNG